MRKLCAALELAPDKDRHRTVAHIASDRKEDFTALAILALTRTNLRNAVSNGHAFISRNYVKMSGLNGRPFDRNLNRHLSSLCKERELLTVTRRG
jgi:hypothetical protein